MARTTMARGVVLKTPAELQAMREAGRVVARTLAIAQQAARPGVSTLELDRLAEQAIREAGALPSFKGYHGFPAALCTSINDEIVHGIPSARRILRAGDLLKIDCGAILDGWQGDAAVTVLVGEGSPAPRRLMEATREALQRGIDVATVGGRVTDIGKAIEDYALSQGYEVVREYCGHGIGREMHEEPPVPNYGPAGQGPKLVPGLVLAIEPMLNAGTWRTTPQPDGWTVKTADGELSAHFEHTVAITEHGPQILTAP
ncbi:MAG: type I methionyl aminopeptidase [Chloroflexota bacterium]|nr:type I methionyl aminopeptidase [Chloroflexota bacterium]